MKSKVFTNFPTCQLVLDFSEHIVRHNDSSAKCKGRKHHVNVLESKSHCKMAETFSSLVHVTVTRQSKSNISGEICNQNSSE